MLSNPYEEAKAIANQGRLALQVKDYPHALVKLQQALAAMNHLGAMYDALALYHDLRRLFSVQGDHARAEEMTSLREREARRLGYLEPNEAQQDYAGGLQLSCHEKSSGAETAHGKMENGNSEELPKPLSVQLQQSRIG